MSEDVLVGLIVGVVALLYLGWWLGSGYLPRNTRAVHRPIPRELMPKAPREKLHEGGPFR